MILGLNARSEKLTQRKGKPMKLFEITLVAIDLGAAAYLIYKWRTLRIASQIILVLLVAVTFVAAMLELVQKFEFIVNHPLFYNLRGGSVRIAWPADIARFVDGVNNWGFQRRIELALSYAFACQSIILYFVMRIYIAGEDRKWFWLDTLLVLAWFVLAICFLDVVISLFKYR